MQILYLSDPGGGSALRVGDPLAPPAVSSPAAAPSGGSAGGGSVSGGDPWWDRDRSDADFLADVARIQREQEGYYEDVELPRPLVEVEATSLRVLVRATMLSVEVTVERGNKIFFVATFSGDPDEVHFSYIRPGEQRPVVDPGYGQPDSGIERVGDGVYFFSVDTTGFHGGKLQWHFWGVGEHGASQFGEIEIPARPTQLL